MVTAASSQPHHAEDADQLSHKLSNATITSFPDQRHSDEEPDHLRNDGKPIDEQKYAATELKYWLDTYQFWDSSILLDVVNNQSSSEHKNEDEQKQEPASAKPQQPSDRPFSIILRSTIVHPQGGGQPSDVGVILPATTPDSDKLTVNDAVQQCDVCFVITHCEKQSETGAVLHHGYFNVKGQRNDDLVPSQHGFAQQKQVLVVIDEAKRRKYARLHSAGHILDLAVSDAGYKSLTAAKGNHSEVGTCVEYTGELTDAERKTFVPAVQAAMDKIVASHSPMRVMIVPYESIAELCGTDAPPSYLPKGETARVVGLEGYNKCTCGGTHVQNSEELGKVTLKKLEKQGKGRWRLKYSVD